MCRQGWLGQKTGIGFYRYRTRTKRIHRAALELLKTSGRGEVQLLSKLPKAVQMRESRERMVLLMVNEAAACLGDGLAANAQTIDLAMVLGSGWAPHRGGPLRYGEERGFTDVVKALEDLAKRLGSRFEPCAVLRAGGKTQLPSEDPG
jgi:3-hydroxyacyl-CoA dehydrogenase/enoyl-CoA hydratase/3-hydroxybutyryl-CoA epimerase